MLTQKVSVDLWKMFFGSFSYLLLALAFYILLKLVHGCFWLPSYLKKMNERDTDNENTFLDSEHEEDLQDKKNV